MTILRYVATLALLLVALHTNAGPVVLSEQDKDAPFGDHAEYLLDDSLNLTLDQVRQRTDFKPGHRTGINLTFTQSRAWVRFDIQNPFPTEQERVLYIRDFLLDEVVLHTPNDTQGSQYSTITQGRHHLENRHQEPSRFFTFRVKVPAHSQYTYYLSATSADSFSLPLYLATQEGHQDFMIRDSIQVTLYCGLILTNICFALFMLGTLRERPLVYYLGFLVFHHLLALPTIEGLPTAVAGITNLYWAGQGGLVYLNIGITFAVLFTRDFLEVKTKAPSLYRISNALLVLMILNVLQTAFLPHFYASIGTLVLDIIAGTGILYVCFRGAILHLREGKLFLPAWSACIIGAGIHGMRLMGVAEIDTFNTYAWPVGVIIESILFSYTIAHRVNSERAERLKTQTLLVKNERSLRLTQEQLLQAETAAKVELEEQVRLRTKDIALILADLEHQNRSLVELSINDGLTKVRNRRFFNDRYPQLWKDAMARGKYLSVVMVDIDHFKAVNDQHGHMVGDQCLVVVADALKQIVSRPTDVVCRYGGEEFILVLPDTDPTAASWVAERCRKKISDAQIELHGITLTLTASLGVAGMVPVGGMDSASLVARSDDALYQSKNNGRNRVTTVDGPKLHSNTLSISRNRPV